MEMIGDYLFEIELAMRKVSVLHLKKMLYRLEHIYYNNHRIFIIGNGGSAATASHLALDLSKNTIIPGAPRVKAISLTDNIPLITAWSNDTTYENIFVEQLENLIEPGDAIIGISTSGNSLNVIHAVELAKRSHAYSIGLLGHSGGKLKDMVDIFVLAPGKSIDQEEDLHMIIAHITTKYMHAVVRARASTQTCDDIHDKSLLGEET